MALLRRSTILGRKILVKQNLDFLRPAFAEVLKAWRCELIEFAEEDDHVHLLVSIHPALEIANLINSLKTASATRCGSVFGDQVRHFYKKSEFWHQACFVGRIGNVLAEVVRRYV